MTQSSPPVVLAHGHSLTRPVMLGETCTVSSRRGHALSACREGGIPLANQAGMCHNCSAEFESRGVWIGTEDQVIPVQDKFSESFVPSTLNLSPSLRWQTRQAPATRTRRMRLWIAGIARPPADLDLLGSARIAHDEILRRRIDLAT